ncbi:hypothetical protein ACGTJS_10515 [Faucicola mancuniensis]
MYAKIKPNYDKIMAEPAIYSTFVFLPISDLPMYINTKRMTAKFIG